MVRKKPLPGSDKVSVTFETTPRDARSVSVAGDFNGWNPSATPMKQRKDGCWSVTLRLPKQEYAYRYVIDGHEWVTDEEADRTVPNEHGGTNSVAVVR
jgi:1,4-alpha-glucan branching enzyme